MMPHYTITATIDEDEQQTNYVGSCVECGYDPGLYNSISNLDARLHRHVMEECEAGK